jgi:hypothetical protein
VNARQEAGARHVAESIVGDGGQAVAMATDVTAPGAAPEIAGGLRRRQARLVGLTRRLATEWAGRGVRVVSVDPGYVATDFVRVSDGGWTADGSW